MVTKLNVNIRMLLLNCEDLAKKEENSWLLQKFIKALDTMINELREYDDPQSNVKIPEYERRLQTVKEKINYMGNPQIVSHGKRNKKLLGTDESDSVLQEMQQLQTAKEYADLRKDLFSDNALRRRKQNEGGASAGSEMSKYYSEAQEKITEHMLSLTRNLKEQTVTANRIIKKDTETVSRSANMTDRNITSLDKETEKLQDHSRNAWKCWMWTMIMFVIAVFIGMVLFMKIMKKKKV